LAPEFDAIANYRLFAFELVDSQEDVLIFEGSQRSPDSLFRHPRLHVLESNSFGCQQIEVGASLVLEYRLFDQAEKILFALGHPAFNGIMRFGEGLLWRHSLSCESSEAF
jgi:hypothetical protein